MGDSREAEGRLFREVKRLDEIARCRRRASGPRRYGLALFWVVLAFAYCSQWLDVDVPHGAATAFLVAVAVSVRTGGPGPGWFALALSIIGMWPLFDAAPGDFPVLRFGWMVIALLTPMIVAGSATTKPLGQLKRWVSRSRRSSDLTHYPIWSDSPSR